VGLSLEEQIASLLGGALDGAPATTASFTVLTTESSDMADEIAAMTARVGLDDGAGARFFAVAVGEVALAAACRARLLTVAVAQGSSPTAAKYEAAAGALQRVAAVWHFAPDVWLLRHPDRLGAGRSGASLVAALRLAPDLSSPSRQNPNPDSGLWWASRAAAPFLRHLADRAKKREAPKRGAGRTVTWGGIDEAGESDFGCEVSPAWAAR
jgi:hypothetical protein